jgi:hypothetical protein
MVWSMALSLEAGSLLDEILGSGVKSMPVTKDAPRYAPAHPRQNKARMLSDTPYNYSAMLLTYHLIPH